MTPPDSVLLSTDMFRAAKSAELKRIWGCDVYTHYGMTEMGYGGGVECQARRGYHMRETDLLFEIIDPQTGTPVKQGEQGDVVFTTLTRRGMPLIRYRTGDLSRFLPGQCPCGTLLKTMAPVKGRIAGQLELEPGVMLSMADLDEALFPVRDMIDFSAELSRECDCNLLQIRATLLEGSSESEAEHILEALKDIPAIGDSAVQGKLRVDVTVQRGSPGPLDGSAKRTIIDMRC